MCLISQPLWMGLLYYWGLFSILFLLTAELCRTLFHYQIFSMIWWQHEGSIMHYCSFFFYFLSIHGTWILCSARFRPRILIDVTSVDLSTTVLGFKISMPIMVAPTAMQRMAHPEGMSIITYCYWHVLTSKQQGLYFMWFLHFKYPQAVYQMDVTDHFLFGWF
jgi:hypothetical protein